MVSKKKCGENRNKIVTEIWFLNNEKNYTEIEVVCKCRIFQQFEMAVVLELINWSCSMLQRIYQVCPCVVNAIKDSAKRGV